MRVCRSPTQSTTGIAGLSIRSTAVRPSEYPEGPDGTDGPVGPDSPDRSKETDTSSHGHFSYGILKSNDRQLSFEVNFTMLAEQVELLFNNRVRQLVSIRRQAGARKRKKTPNAHLHRCLIIRQSFYVHIHYLSSVWEPFIIDDM